MGGWVGGWVVYVCMTMHEWMLQCGLGGESFNKQMRQRLNLPFAVMMCVGQLR